MNKREIVLKLQTDQRALEVLLASQFASDLAIELNAKFEYISTLLEWIQQEKKA